jgi:hypothetical protein
MSENNPAIFVVTDYTVSNPVAQDTYFTDATRAVAFALTIPHCGVATDARRQVEILHGKVVRVATWDEFYYGEPSEAWMALNAVVATVPVGRCTNCQGFAHSGSCKE